MKQQSGPILFITSKLSRGLVTLAAALQKRGIEAVIASPAGHGEAERLRTRHIGIFRIRMFRKIFLIPSVGLREFISRARPRVHVADHPALGLAKRMKLDFNDSPLEFGVDLSVFNPGSVAPTLQSRFLSEFNIAPHQKLVTVISPLGWGLGALLRALPLVPSEDIVIALYGSADRIRAAGIIRQIARAQQKHRITFIGPDTDMATILRSSYAVMSLARHDPSLLKSAIATGRPAIWPDNEFGVNPNIMLDDANLAESIAGALNMISSLSVSERSRIEKLNIAAAQKFDIEKTTKQLIMTSR